MGQKVSPIGFRTGITLGWKSRWFAPKSNFGEFLVEDQRMRKFIDDRLNRQPPYAAIAAIEIERTREEVKVSLKTARPGLVIGPKGAEVDRLKNALEDLTDRRVNINIVEIRNPDLDAMLVAEGISEQLKRRSSFRRTLKQRAEGTMLAGAKGVRVQVSGRLGGAEMCRTETTNFGSVPLQTLEADVDYGFVPCHTTYGTIGVKVWIYRGMFGEERPEEQAPAGGPGGGRGGRRPPRRGGGGGGGAGGARRGGRRGRRDEKSTPASPRPGGSRLGARRAAEASKTEQKEGGEQAKTEEAPKAEEPSAKPEGEKPGGESTESSES
ncbi:MAG: 30S ribosomal protein S3 [Planctomycetota bacterium]